MVSKPDTQSQSDSRGGLVIAVVALVLSATAMCYGTGLHPLWVVTWVASLPVLVVSSRLSARSAFLVAFASWFIGGLNMWHYLYGLLTIPWMVCLEILALPALFFALSILMFRTLLRRRGGWLAAFSFPAAWVSYEYLSSLFSPHSTFGNISYSQMNFLPVLQLASITGIWGISFCLFLLPATIAICLAPFGDSRQKRRIALATLLLLGTVFGYGYWRLHRPLAPADSVSIGMIASDIPRNRLAGDRDDALRLVREYAAQSEILAARGARVVVIPEKTAVVLDSYRDAVDSILQSTADRTGTMIVIGLIDVTAHAKWNEARLYVPGTSSPTTYAKHHMLPSYESSFTLGTSRTEFAQPSGRWGLTICKDMDFPLLSRQYGNDGTALLLVPAWDFSIDGWLHGRMAILRGVESGFSIVRSAKQGILTVTDNRGRVLAEQETGASDFVTLLADVPVRHDSTVYARFGDWFAGLILAGLLGCVVALLRKPRAL
jgi:apolipoprotein N-acyltransferase